VSQPDVFRLSAVGEHRYTAHRPEALPEGRDVVFSGQLLGQMMMASAEASSGAKEVRSVHAVFARAGNDAQPLEFQVDHMHAGRTWASDTVTAVQGGKLVSRALVLMNTVDGDLIRHGPEMPDVAGPDALESGPGLAFPGAELRAVPGEAAVAGVPVQRTWHRYAPGVASPTANQAVLAWATCGSLIGLAFRPHPDVVDIADAHRTVSTGVIAHTVHFLEPFDVAQWLLVEEEATGAATGRVYGRGRVFTGDGTLVAAYEQDSMARASAAPLGASRSL
jgi:acyl-CoA thioesterase